MATFVALLIYAGGLVPVTWLAWRPSSAGRLFPVLAALIVGLAFLQTGVFRASSLASTDVAHFVRADTPENRCQQVFAVLTDNGVLLQDPGPEGLVVRGASWDQLPQPVREGVTACAQAALSVESAEDINIVRR